MNNFNVLREMSSVDHEKGKYGELLAADSLD